MAQASRWPGWLDSSTADRPRHPQGPERGEGGGFLVQLQRNLPPIYPPSPVVAFLKADPPGAGGGSSLARKGRRPGPPLMSPPPLTSRKKGNIRHFVHSHTDASFGGFENLFGILVFGYHDSIPINIPIHNCFNIATPPFQGRTGLGLQAPPPRAG